MWKRQASRGERSCVMKETSSSATDPRQPSAAKPYVPPTLSPQDLPIDYAGFLAVIFGVLGVTLRFVPGNVKIDGLYMFDRGYFCISLILIKIGVLVGSQCVGPMPETLIVIASIRDCVLMDSWLRYHSCLVVISLLPGFEELLVVVISWLDHGHSRLRARGWAEISRRLAESLRSLSRDFMASWPLNNRELPAYKLCSWLAIIFCAQSFANMKSFENDSKQLSMAFMFGVMGLVTNYLGPRPVKKS
ncbi:hypothetical protein ZIOFF_043519 [Zingiber officinale]|uniref:Uncharacterized protein n=1 Tax=Zingiber officinale TaxID=94328 RepID=A0A8J5FV37_ZINOF|nr:hypothetical protein ZIOFF_043519 [Zingiber officinale]